MRDVHVAGDERPRAFRLGLAVAEEPRVVARAEVARAEGLQRMLHHGPAPEAVAGDAMIVQRQRQLAFALGCAREGTVQRVEELGDDCGWRELRVVVRGAADEGDDEALPCGEERFEEEQSVFFPARAVSRFRVLGNRIECRRPIAAREGRVGEAQEVHDAERDAAHRQERTGTVTPPERKLLPDFS